MMDYPPSCSAWSRVVTSENSRFIISSRSLSNTFEPIENERYYCEPEDDSLSDEKGGSNVVAPPEEFRDIPWSFRKRPDSPPPILRPSSSHNSLSLPGANRADDSSFITSAISHDTITDLYNVPVGSDIYTLPVDTIPRRRTTHSKHHKEKRRRRHTSTGHDVIEKERKGVSCEEPVHMTLQEVRQFLHNLYSSEPQPKGKEKTGRSVTYLLKKALCSVFRFRNNSKRAQSHNCREANKVIVLEAPRSLADRALPPLPATPPPVPTLSSGHPPPAHFADSLDRVKNCGWYWGPVSGEAAEKILNNEPDGSFIVRDSSDDHYIFSLTFRLNGCVRHVRIEHDQGNFSFGSCTKFKSQTIVDFIETAVEHSRSGRYLFFLHRRPVLGPMRVQLLHPVSRFKHIQSLQHLCRFVILKTVRRDLIADLPLPRRLIDYLNSPHYYSEQLADQLDPAPSHSSPVHLVSFAPPPPSRQLP